MEIYKGKLFTITTDGITALKTDGKTVRQMKYFPERDIAALAGEINELTAWKILRDIAKDSAAVPTPVSPEHIFIDNNRFVLSEWSESRDEKFTAPEGYSPVWALGATVFYTFLGCHVFQGLGGKGQGATTPIPTLRRELPHLSDILIKCLDFCPDNRPKMSEIQQIAEENILRCNSTKQDAPPLKKGADKPMTADEIETFWPEKMC